MSAIESLREIEGTLSQERDSLQIKRDRIWAEFAPVENKLAATKKAIDECQNAIRTLENIPL
jgi:predicted  nucleic acid-binding Zn-ribbon protein